MGEAEPTPVQPIDYRTAPPDPGRRTRVIVLVLVIVAALGGMLLLLGLIFVQRGARAVVVTATPTCAVGATPEYRWLLQDPAGNWSMVGEWTSSALFNWNTAGLAPGTWNVGVWVRASGSGATQATRAIPYTLN